MAGLPRLIRPMLATCARAAGDEDLRLGVEVGRPARDRLRQRGEVRLVSRNDKEMAASYPELAVLADRVGTPVILDGEIVALRDGRPGLRVAAIPHARPAAAAQLIQAAPGAAVRLRPAAPRR